MRVFIAALVALLAAADATVAAPVPDRCEVPGALLFGDGTLAHVEKVITAEKRLTVAVLGTASSVLPGPDGSNVAYPGQLAEALRKRLPAVTITMIPHAFPSQTADRMVAAMHKLLLDDKPDLVVWQTGTVDAMRGIDPDEFRSTLEEGVEAVRGAGADIILMNMQYSPRTAQMIALGAYVENMRFVAREREFPLFDRLAVMRHWSDVGAFDFNVAKKDMVTARQVHECIGRVLAALVIEAANLGSMGSTAPQ